MKLAVVGSRTFNDYELLCATLNPHLGKIQVIVSGGAKGADSLAERWAKENGVATEVYLPEWEKYGKSAGFKRNELIVENCDSCVAFWDGVSPGTKSSIDLCKKKGKKHKVILWRNFHSTSPRTE
jgi:hypothetical protein